MKNQPIYRILKIVSLLFLRMSCASELPWKVNKKEGLAYLASEVAKFGREELPFLSRFQIRISIFEA